jgi:hypothetical protein
MRILSTLRPCSPPPLNCGTSGSLEGDFTTSDLSNILTLQSGIKAGRRRERAGTNTGKRRENMGNAELIRFQVLFWKPSRSIEVPLQDTVTRPFQRWPP